MKYLILLALFSFCLGTNYYLSPTGDDSNNCLDEETPCKNLLAVSNLIDAGDDDADIYVKTGNYNFNETVVFSSDREYEITIEDDEGNNAVFTPLGTTLSCLSFSNSEVTISGITFDGFQSAVVFNDEENENSLTLTNVNVMAPLIGSSSVTINGVDEASIDGCYFEGPVILFTNMSDSITVSSTTFNGTQIGTSSIGLQFTDEAGFPDDFTIEDSFFVNSYFESTFTGNDDNEGDDGAEISTTEFTNTNGGNVAILHAGSYKFTDCIFEGNDESDTAVKVLSPDLPSSKIIFDTCTSTGFTGGFISGSNLPQTTVIFDGHTDSNGVFTFSTLDSIKFQGEDGTSFNGSQILITDALNFQLLNSDFTSTSVVAVNAPLGISDGGKFTNQYISVSGKNSTFSTYSDDDDVDVFIFDGNMNGLRQISIGNGVNTSITSSTFQNSDSGHIDFSGTFLAIKNSLFSNGNATKGGCLMLNAKTSIEETTFENCNAMTYGGAIQVEADQIKFNVSFSEVTISKSTAVVNGTAINCCDGTGGCNATITYEDKDSDLVITDAPNSPAAITCKQLSDVSFSTVGTVPTPEDISGDSPNLTPLWITLGVLGGLVVIGLVVGVVAFIIVQQKKTDYDTIE